MQYLNLIYFLIISMLGYYYLISDGKILKGALNPNISYHYSGLEVFWCLIFGTGLLAFSANVGIDLMAVRLLVLEIFCIIGISISKNNIIVSFPLKIYLIFLAWIFVGVFYSPGPIYGFRTILKYLYPLLLCLFASCAVSDSEVFFKSSKWARIVAITSLIYSFITFLHFIFPGVFWYGTARAINYISIMIFSLGMFCFSNSKVKNLLYTVLFLAPCFIWVLRTSIMGSAIALMAFSFIKYKLKSIPIILGILILGIVSVFAIPSVRQKMFKTDKFTIEDFKNGKIDEDDINTNYRAFMWEKLQDKFYKNHELVGSGTGTVQWYMYSHSEEFGNLMVPHSDFVQQKCDNGLIGLLLYGCMVLAIFIDCFRTYHSSTSPPIRLCAIVAGASLLGVYATFYSDNTVNYSMATLAMPFGFYGMLLGMRRAYQTSSNNLEDSGSNALVKN